MPGVFEKDQRGHCGCEQTKEESRRDEVGKATGQDHIGHRAPVKTDFTQEWELFMVLSSGVHALTQKYSRIWQG